MKRMNRPPKGYKKVEGAINAPKGYSYYSNGKSRFGGERKTVLVKNNQEKRVNNEV